MVPSVDGFGVVGIVVEVVVRPRVNVMVVPVGGAVPTGGLVHLHLHRNTSCMFIVVKDLPLKCKFCIAI